MARCFVVQGRRRKPDSVGLLDIWKDFNLEEERAVDAEVLHRDPAVHLYTFDPQSQCVAFVKIPEGVSIEETPFLYQALRKDAIVVYLLTLEEVHRLAADISLDEKNILLIYGVARCGSTLIQRVLAETDGVAALSEPDIYTQLARPDTGLSEEATRVLLRDATKILRHEFCAGDDLLAIKFRAQVSGLWGPLDAALNHPKSLFLYRDALKMAQSWDRVMGCPHGRLQWLLRWPGLAALARLWLRMDAKAITSGLGTTDTGLVNCSAVDAVLDIGWCAFGILVWLNSMEAYREAISRNGNAAFAMRYEDIAADHVGSIRALFREVGLPERQVAVASRAVKSDSQAGTFLARGTVSHPLDQRTLDAINRLVRDHTAFGTPSVKLPNTLQPVEEASA